MAQMFPASAMPDPDWWEALWPQPERTVASLGIASGMRVVDLCCGDGLFTLPMARLAAEVVAIDLNSEMLKRVRARLDLAGINNCALLRAMPIGLPSCRLGRPTWLSWRTRSTACRTKPGCVRQ